MSAQSTNVVSGLGALIGYIGAEAATEDVFERLFWPQRFFNAVSWSDVLQIGLLGPMGGPLHKAALNTLDKLHHNGLFKGAHLGNMLGTAFFRDTHLTGKIHHSKGVVGTQQLRNCIWVRAILRIPAVGKDRTSDNPEAGMESPKVIRAKCAVNLLELSYAKGSIDSAKVVKNDVGTSSLCLLAIIWSESTGLAMGALVGGYWRSYFSFLWFLPLFLKVVSAVFSLPREQLLPHPSKDDHTACEIKRFEVDTRGHGFLVIEGTEAVALQFFRHYGHPVRNRALEILQIGIVVAFGLVFPVGLLCSIIWMPPGVQYAWLGYQVYASIALYAYRYTRGHEYATTESRLAEKFALGSDEDRMACLQDQSGITVVGRLTRTYAGNNAEGQKAVKALLMEYSTEASTEKAKDEEVSHQEQSLESCETKESTADSCD